MIRLLALFILFSSGCSSMEKIEPEGEIFVSIMRVESAHTGSITKKEGFEFYIEKTQEGMLGPFLNGYRYEDGKIIEAFDQGSGGGDFVREIEQVKLQPFDFEVEYDLALGKYLEDYPVYGGVRDGSRWRFIIATKKGTFELNDWNIQSTIEFLEPYSPNFKKLNTILKILARYYGSCYVHM